MTAAKKPTPRVRVTVTERRNRGYINSVLRPTTKTRRYHWTDAHGVQHNELTGPPATGSRFLDLLLGSILLAVIIGAVAFWYVAVPVLLVGGLALLIVGVVRAKTRRMPQQTRPASPPDRQAPPVMRTADGRWISYDGGDHFYNAANAPPPPPPPPSRPVQQPRPVPSDVANGLLRLSELHRRGELSDEEFVVAKTKLLS
jgi:hypothetical protein